MKGASAEAQTGELLQIHRREICTASAGKSLETLLCYVERIYLLAALAFSSGSCSTLGWGSTRCAHIGLLSHRASQHPSFRLLAWTLIVEPWRHCQRHSQPSLTGTVIKRHSAGALSGNTFTFPVLGIALALFVYAIIRIGMAAFGGDLGHKLLGRLSRSLRWCGRTGRVRLSAGLHMAGCSCQRIV